MSFAVLLEDGEVFHHRPSLSLVRKVDEASSTRWIEDQLIAANPGDIGFQVAAGFADDGERAFDCYALPRLAAAAELRKFRKAHAYIERGEFYYIEGASS